MNIPGANPLRLLCGLVFGLSSWLLCGMTIAAHAAVLKVEALSLPYAEPWRRATPQQEAEEDALLLEAPEAALHLAAPRQTRLLNWDAETYYAKLSENWKSLYGDKARISWLETDAEHDGRKWLLCRRPSRLRDVDVFHLATVFAGRTYSVLLFAPSTSATFPRAAMDLLAAARFDAESAQSSSRSGWVKARAIYPRSSGDILQALIQDDAARLGKDGLVTGYGLDFSRDPDRLGVAWFIEGYRWQTMETRVDQLAWSQSGRAEARAADDLASWSLQIALRESESDVRVQLRVWDICAASARVADTLEQLQSGHFEALPMLARERAAACPEVGAATETALLAGETGKTVQTIVPTPLPETLGAAQSRALQEAGLTHYIVVEMALVPGPRRTGFGERLLERARGYVIFARRNVEP